MKNKINIICGTTASGKTAYGASLAKELDGIVINADSMQIYSEIPILTAQPTPAEQMGVEHRLYGFISCTEAFSVGKWINLVIQEIERCFSLNKTPILVGGTGMYIKSLIEGLSETPAISIAVKDEVAAIDSDRKHAELLKLDPAIAAILKPNDIQRITRALEVIKETGISLLEWQKKRTTPHFERNQFHLIMIARDRQQIYDNIDQRFLDMLDAGALEEVEALLHNNKNATFPKAHGLPEIINFLNGEIDKEEMIRKSQQNVRNYAKRQLTWFKNQLSFDQIIEL